MLLSNLLYFAGAFVMGWLISGIFLAALVFALESPSARLLVANGAALVASELLYRTIDARFYFPGGAVIYAAAQLACLGSQWMLVLTMKRS